jgi:hypothetical protein
MRKHLLLFALLGGCQMPSTLPPAVDYISVTISEGENILFSPSILVQQNQSAEISIDDWVIRVNKQHSVEALTTDPGLGGEIKVDVDIQNVGTIQFEKMKSLAGEWEAVEGDFASPIITYEVSSGGNSVIERLFPGEEHEMITMYHMQDNRLVMTHYCSIGNQPFLIAEPSIGDSISFQFVRLGNMKDKNEHHIHGLEMIFHSKDEVTANWTSNKNDAPDPEAGASFHVKRIKRF